MVETKKPKKRYSYIESPNHPKQTCIGINEGKWSGVIYKYGKVTPIEKDGGLTMQFEFDILDNNLIPKEEFKEDWTDLIGDILVDIIDHLDRFMDSDIPQIDIITNR